MSRRIAQQKYVELANTTADYATAFDRLIDAAVASGLASTAEMQAATAGLPRTYEGLLFAMVAVHEHTPAFVDLSAAFPIAFDSGGRAVIGFGYDLTRNRGHVATDLITAGVLDPRTDAALIALARQYDASGRPGDASVSAAHVLADQLNNGGVTASYTSARRLFDIASAEKERTATRLIPGLGQSVERAMLVDGLYNGVFVDGDFNQVGGQRGAFFAAMRAGDFEEAFVILAFTDDIGGYDTNRALNRAMVFGSRAAGDSAPLSLTSAMDFADALDKYHSDISAKRASSGLSSQEQLLLELELSNLIDQINVTAEENGIHIVGSAQGGSSPETMASIASNAGIDVAHLEELYGASNPPEFARLMLPRTDPAQLSGATVLSGAPSGEARVVAPINGSLYTFTVDNQDRPVIAGTSQGAVSLLDTTMRSVGTLVYSGSVSVSFSAATSTTTITLDGENKSVSYRTVPDSTHEFGRRVEITYTANGVSKTYDQFDRFEINGQGAVRIQAVRVGNEFAASDFDDQAGVADLLQIPQFAGARQYASNGTVVYPPSLDGVIDPDGAVITSLTIEEDGTEIYETAFSLDNKGEGVGDSIFATVVYEPSAVDPSSITVSRVGLESTVTAIRENPGGGPADFRNIEPKYTIEYPNAYITGEQIGSIFGSTIGRYLGDGDLAESILYSAILSTVTSNIGEIIDNFIFDPPNIDGTAKFTAEQKIDEALQNLPEDLLQNLASAGAGAISSLLTAELFRSLGLEGDLAEGVQSVANAYLSQVIQNVATFQNPFEGLDSINPANIVGAYIGTKLASSLVEFDSLSGQIGASIGAAAYSYYYAAVGTALFGPIGGFIGAVWGAFEGYIRGGFIGSLLGITPKSNADLVWDSKMSSYRVVRVSAKHGASTDGIRSVAEATKSALEGVIVAVGGVVISEETIGWLHFGTKGKKFFYESNAHPKFTHPNGERVLSAAIFYNLTDLTPHLAGGDYHMKRALVASLDNVNGPGSFDIATLSGDLIVAQDYGAYIDNSAEIDRLIAAEPESAFAAGWIVTLARAKELGLDRRSYTDWVGGWSLFLDEVGDGVVDGGGLSPQNVIPVFSYHDSNRSYLTVDQDGEVLGFASDTVVSGAKNVIVGGASADVVTVSGATILDTSGLTIDDEAALGSAFQIDVAAVLDGGEGDDTVRAGDLGNDVLGGDGNDKLVGGKLDDWLLGGMGDDVLFAGNVSNINFTVTDTAARNAALAVDGGNGDLLDGGDGNDRLYGGTGSEWLKGGDGADWLYGGAGGDIIEGGAGDDQGAGGAPMLFGGAGTDQYVFGYGDGQDVIFDEADEGATPGSTGDSHYQRVTNIGLGSVARDWAGDGDYLADGSVKGGSDAIAFGPGITMRNLIMKRSGTTSSPGQDLIIQLTAADEYGVQQLTGDQMVIKDWFESTRRVEWLRFADGTDIRIGDTTTYLIGTGGSDVIVGTQGNDFLYGGEGNDTIRGLGGHDFGNAGPGNDFISGDDDNDWVMGESGDDRVLGGLGNDTVFGDQGDDFVYGGGGNDLIVGAQGEDELIGGVGSDIFRYSRGDGRDVIMDELVNNWDYVWQNGAYVNGYQENPDGTVSQYGVTYFDGTSWIGRYDYASNGDAMRRHKGMLNGRITANDFYHDYLEFGAGINIQDLAMELVDGDLVIAIVDENYTGTAMEAEDRIIIKEWTPALPTVTKMVFLATGSHDFINATVGTASADVLTAGSQVDAWMVGGAGDDEIYGGTGADNWLFGGAGNDEIWGEGVLFGQAGDDEIHLEGTSGIAYGGDGDDTIIGTGDLYGDFGDDILQGGGNLFGGVGDDVLQSDGAGNVLDGGEGEDTADYSLLDYGLDGNGAPISGPGVNAYLSDSALNSNIAQGDSYVSIENLTGSQYGDILGGDGETNVLTGGAGNDLLMGGGGDDVYVWEAGDGSDNIQDHQLTLEQAVDSNGDLLPGFTPVSQLIGTSSSGGVTYYHFRLTVTDDDTGEIVYQTRDNIDAVYPAGQVPPVIPPAGTWPYGDGQWKNGYSRTSADPTVSRVIGDSGYGGYDTLALAGVTLSDLTFSWSGDDLVIDIEADGEASQLILVGQADPDTAIDDVEFAEGGGFEFSTLRLPGDSATSGVDTMVGTAGADTLSGLAGADWLVGGAGNDTLSGGDGDDLLEGGAGADSLDGGADRVSDGLDVDPDDPTAYGDTISYAASPAGVSIDLAAATASGGDAQGDTIVTSSGVSTIENVTGSEFADTLLGDSRDNRLIGGGGADTLNGRGGNDVLIAADGDAATLIGGDGEDNLFGGSSLDGGNDDDLLFTTYDGAQLDGGAGNDRLTAGDGADTLDGGDGEDVLDGGAGDDVLHGDADDDVLVGGDGDDQLFGDDGADILFGAAGDDELDGGLGDDIYAFDTESGTDRIFGADGTDTIQISGVTIDQIWLTRENDDLKVSVIGGDTVVYIDNFYASTGAADVSAIEIGSQVLYLHYAEPLVDAMTQASPESPPQTVTDLLPLYWHEDGKAPPLVSDLELTAVVDTPLEGEVGAVDHDNNITGYAVVTGPTLGALTLDTVTGEWTYTSTVTGADSFIISVTDADGYEAEQTVDLTIDATPPAGVNPPTIDTQGLIWVNQNLTASGQTVATFDAPPAGQSLELSVNPYNWFTISNNELRLNSGFPIDFDTMAQQASQSWRTITDIDSDGQLEVSLAVSVRTTDGSGSSDPTVVYFRVEDQNQAPWGDYQTIYIDENAPVGMVLDTVLHSDFDTQAYNRDFRFSIDATADEYFDIDPLTGELSIGKPLNYEELDYHFIDIAITDQGGTGLAGYGVVEVYVNDLNEAPIISSLDPLWGAYYMYYTDPDGTWEYNVDHIVVQQVYDMASPYTPAFDPSQPHGFGIMEGQMLKMTIAFNAYPQYTSGDIIINNYGGLSSPPDFVAQIQLTDTGGNQSIQYLHMELGSLQVVAPIVLDLDGDGLELVKRKNSSIMFDVDGDGQLDNTGWVKGDDGLLALDRNGDGQITTGAEISFTGDDPYAISDLEGLRSFDSNKNGFLDAGDERFGEFQVWRDINQDGVSQTEELASLTDHGVDAISLSLTPTGQKKKGAKENLVYGTSWYVATDGQVREVGDIVLSYYDNTVKMEVVENPLRYLNRDKPSESGPDYGDEDFGPGKSNRRAEGGIPEAYEELPSSPTNQLESMETTSSDSDTTSSTENTTTTADTEVEPTYVELDGASYSLAEGGSTEEGYIYEGSSTTSALDSSLELSGQTTLLMVEAMASFDPEYGTDLSLTGSTNTDSNSMKLLTSLPDLQAA